MISALAVLLLLPFIDLSAEVIGKSVFWEPYTYDGDTQVLCHFDGEQLVSAAEVLELEVDDDGDPEDLLGVAPAGDGPRTVNSTPMKNADVPLLGACKENKGVGRFGGGLRLTGKDGRITIKAKAGRGWGLEAWFRAARLPDKRATLFDLPHGLPMRLSLLANGRLQMQWLGKGEPELSDWRAEAEEWFHLSLVWQPTGFHVHHVTRGEMLVFINGNRILRSGEQSAATFSQTVSGEVTVGNDSRGKSGFDGWLDELRLSNTARAYYFLDLDWVDRAGERPEPPGQPYFRDAESLVFRTPFDRTLTPVDNAQGASLAAGIPSDATALAEGHKGWGFDFGEGVAHQALLLKPGDKEVRYEGLPVSAEQGSIAFWIRPRDWDNGKLWNRFADFKQEFAPVFRMEQDEKKVVAVTWIKTPDNDAYSNPVDFNPGAWQHLVLTWQDGKINRIYLNGEHWSHWGTVHWHYDRKAWDPAKPVSLVLPPVKDALYLDDFRVYKRPLAPSEAANLAALYDRRTELKPLQDYDYIKNVNGVFGTARVKLWPLLKEYSHVHAATLTFTPAGESKVIGTARVDVEPDKPFDLEVKAKPFGFGDYTLTVTSFDKAGTELNSFTIPHTRVKPPWWECQAGISDKVMPDWTPVVVNEKERRVEILLRQFHFADSGLPAKVISAGEDILAGPVELVATEDGKETAFKPVSGSFKVKTKGEVRADFSGTSKAGAVAADVKGYIEFDGFTWFEVTLKGAAVSTLQLRIPYTANAANLLHAWGGESWFRSPHNVRIMEVLEAPGTVFSSVDKNLIRTVKQLRGSFMPYAFLTGDRRGMAWFAENDKGWTQSTETPALAIERLENGNVVLALNIISEKVDLTTPRTFAFGLHPTPVKKLDPAWRSWAWWTVAPDSFCGFGMKGENPASTQFNRVPESWELAKSRFESAVSWGQKEPGNHPLTKQVRGIYYDLRGIGAPPDDAREWWGDWYGYGWGKGSDTLRYTQECIDFTAYYHNEWVRRGLAYGIYMDDAWNAPQKAVPGPAAYLLEDRHMQPGFEWRGQRESLKRLRQIFYDHGLTPHMCVHLTHTQYPMWLSFFDEMYDGEDHDLRPAGHPTDFMDYWKPHRLRFHNSQKFGVAPYFHGWVGNNMKDNMGLMPTWKFKQERAYAAALMLHDLGWLCEALPGSLGKTWDWVRPNILNRKELVYVPYWDSAPPAAHKHRDLYVSAWKRDGWCAVVLVNYSKERIEAEVRLDPKSMGLGNASPEQVTIRQVDEHLLSYFDEDVTQLKAPDAEKIAETALLHPTAEPEPGDFEAGADNEEDELDELGFKEKITPEKRRARDPDGKFEWKDGVLKCPVRPHDFRLFEFGVRAR